LLNKYKKSIWVNPPEHQNYYILVRSFMRQKDMSSNADKYIDTILHRNWLLEEIIKDQLTSMNTFAPIVQVDLNNLWDEVIEELNYAGIDIIFFIRYSLVSNWLDCILKIICSNSLWLLIVCKT